MLLVFPVVLLLLLRISELSVVVFSDKLSLAEMKQSYGGASSSAAPQPKNLLMALNQSEVRQYSTENSVELCTC